MLTTKTPWVVLLLLWMGGSTYWHVCRIKQLCLDDATPSTPVSVATPTRPFTVPGLQFSDGTSTTFRSPGHLAFAKSGADANLNGIRPLLDSLALYLKSNPDKQLQLTGFYDVNEQNSSSESNLGVGRANSIRAYLMSLGIPEGQFQVVGAEKPDLSFTPAGDSLYGGVQFAFLDEVLVKEQKSTEEELANGETFASIFEPMDLYFNTGKIDYIRTAETVKFLEKTKAYLKEHPEQKLLVTGHTDNSGPDALNLTLSRKRADAVKMQFVKAGIAASQIEVEGKGEILPIASNNTEEGRRANRRTSVVVKK
ncbi:OOP family OmpA-OmpF porin [Larkinella arboricola]|uniref:OOP family OmpA-OmpF porin n=1 Tax=Larkinella arboricola TaxID=643671 RepID=A0A327X3Z0_LARAB|nr:OmpA family protein [Larkinella arboricola]RAJ99802.1 OOP family OmpA-OmpF porin [Larkinella arboricola]